MRISLSRRIPLATALYSALSFIKHMHILCVEIGPFAEQWEIIYPTGNAEVYS